MSVAFVVLFYLTYSVFPKKLDLLEILKERIAAKVVI